MDFFAKYVSQSILLLKNIGFIRTESFELKGAFGECIGIIVILKRGFRKRLLDQKIQSLLMFEYVMRSKIGSEPDR